MELTNNALAQCLNIHDLFRNFQKKRGVGGEKVKSARDF